MGGTCCCFGLCRELDANDALDEEYLGDSCRSKATLFARSRFTDGKGGGKGEIETDVMDAE